MAGKHTRSLIQFVVLLSVGILLIWLSVKQVAPEKEKIFDSFVNANYFWIGIAMLLSFLSHFLRAYRWNYLLSPLGYRIDIVNATCHVLVGYLANYGIPRMGEISRCTLAAKYNKVPFEVGFGTVITERIVDFFLFILIFILTLAFQFTELSSLARSLIFDKISGRASGSPAPLYITLVCLIVCAILLFIFRKKIALLLRGKIGGVIKGMGRGIGSIAKLERPAAFIFLSLLIWACYFYSLYVCLFALPGTSHLGQRECLTLLLFGTFGVIFSPGGLGAYPAIVGGILLYTFHVDTASAFALPWLSWTSQFVLVLALGLVSLIVLPLYNRTRNVVSPAAE